MQLKYAFNFFSLGSFEITKKDQLDVKQRIKCVGCYLELI